MGARSSNWRARPNETSVFDEQSAAPETSFFDGKTAAPETSVFDKKSAAPETSVFDKKSAAPETSFFDGKSAAPETRVFDEKSAAPKTSARSTFLTPDGQAFPTTECPIQISAIGGHPFRRLAYKQKLMIFSTSLYEINQALGMGEQAKKPKELDLKDYVPAEYHEFLPLFSETLAKKLPPHRPYDHPTGLMTTRFPCEKDSRLLSARYIQSPEPSCRH